MCPVIAGLLALCAAMAVVGHILEQRRPVEALEDPLCRLVTPKVTCKWNGAEEQSADR